MATSAPRSPRPGLRGRGGGALFGSGRGTRAAAAAITRSTTTTRIWSDGQRRGRPQVEQVRGEQVDLGLDAGVAHAAEGQHDAERRRAEQEDHRRRRDSAGRSAGSVTVRSTCRGVAPRAAAASAGRGSSPSHARADRTDHHGGVEEREPGDDGDRRAVEPEEPERSCLPEQLAERHPDHDRRAARRARAASRAAADAAARPGDRGRTPPAARAPGTRACPPPPTRA